MPLSTSLGAAWAPFWTLRRQRPESAWARLLIANVLAFALSVALVLLAGLLRLAWSDPDWWTSVAMPVVGIGLAMGNTLLCTFRVVERANTPATLAWLDNAASWRAGLLINTVAAWGIVTGCAIGIGLVSVLHGPALWEGLADPRRRTHLALVLLVLIGAAGMAWLLRVRRRSNRRRATYAQLHLLQAYIEPQFLFNTLAHVQALLDYDPERASAMLEEFTDYLRASLIALHRTDTTLAAELDLTVCYLQLLRHRMGERLRFSTEASVQAGLAAVPPGLLQPLVEYALGLDPAGHATGAALHINAGLPCGQLEIAVSSDGGPFSATPEQAGAALENLRTRLHARYGSAASLAWSAQGPATQALLSLPFVGASVDSSQPV